MPLTEYEVEVQFGKRYQLIATQLKDLSKCVPTAVTIPGVLEDIPDFLEGEMEAIQQIMDDANRLLTQYNEIEKEFKQFYRSITTRDDQKVAQLWSDNLCTSSKILDLYALVTKQRREHFAIFKSCKTTLGRTKRQLGLAQPTVPAPAATLVTAQFKLPDVPIPIFYGDVMDYKFFCKIFKKRVEDKPIDDEEKFSLLLAHLRGKPLELVKHLPLNTVGYNQAKERLRRNYGNVDVLVDIITKRIFSLRRCTNHDDVRAMFENADAWLSQLDDVKGAECKSNEFHRHLEQLLPKPYASRVIKAKPIMVDWDLKAFREVMRKLVSEDDEVNQMTGSSTNSKKTENQQRQQKSFGLATVPTTQRTNNCNYCNSTNHTTSKCRLPPKLKSGKILKAGRCTRCLRKGHFNKNCEAEPCRRCSGRHHTFLCYKPTESRESSNKESNKGEQNTIAFSAIKSSTKPFFKKARSPRLMRKPITFRSVGLNAWNGPKYLLLTRIVTVFNPLTGWACKVEMMIDPGSTNTYITNDLQRKLKLKNGPTRSVNMLRFGDKQPSKNLTGPK